MGIITSISGVKFDEAFNYSESKREDDLNMPVISKGRLIKNKEAPGREKNFLDVKILKKQTDH